MNRAQRRAAQFKRGPMRQIHQADPAAGLHLLHIARPYEPDEMAEEHVATRIAYERLRTGHGSEDDFDRVSMILNVGLVRAEQVGDGEILVENMQRAQQAMLRAQARYLRGHNFGFDAEGLADVPRALDDYESIMDASTPLQMKQAIQQAYARITGGEVLEVPNG